MVTINKLSALDTLKNADQFVVYSADNGDAGYHRPSKAPE